MAVDYKQQYRPDQLEPFWPNEIIKMSVAVLVTLAVIMFLAVLPVLLETLGVTGLTHEAEPANPHGATPIGIKPEWYFLATYEYLRLMPTKLLGISGKTWGVLSQGPLMLAILLLPFWYRRAAHRQPSWWYRIAITLVLAAFLLLTIWGGWPEVHGHGGEQLAPLSEYVSHHPLFFVMLATALTIFYILIWRERRAIRRLLDSPPPSDTKAEDQ